jgi:Zn-dependent protease with chaperone function
MITIFLVLLVIAITATATLCASVLFVGLVLMLVYNSSRAHHLDLLRRSHRVTPASMPELAKIVDECITRLNPGPVQVFVTPSRALNAYTFGLDSPKGIVLYSALLDVMDKDELRFIIGHEMGHVALGHTWLNSLVGGMAGIPSSSTTSALLTLSLLWWNRTCEYSADRAGLLACGDLNKAITALIKLVAGPAGSTRRGLELAYRQIDMQDDTFLGDLGESLSSHPMLIRRINALRKWAANQ